MNRYVLLSWLMIVTISLNVGAESPNVDKNSEIRLGVEKPQEMLNPIRDRLESELEFQARRQKLLSDYNWTVEQHNPLFQASVATLDKKGYQSETGKFPLRIKWLTWAKQELDLLSENNLTVKHEDALKLWEEGKEKPVFVKVKAVGNHSRVINPVVIGLAQEWPLPIGGISLENPELPNLHQVTDNLYRGAQPTAEGFKELEKMGVKTIINLRGLHSDEDLLKNTRLSYESIRFNTWHPEDEDTIKFLQIVTDKNRYPIFVHCQHGADRTGTMIAIYRIAIQKWTKEEAIKEMTDGNYGFHAIWQNLISYLNDLNVEAIKAAAKIP